MITTKELIKLIKKRCDNVRVNAEDWEKARAFEDIEDMISEYASE